MQLHDLIFPSKSTILWSIRCFLQLEYVLKFKLLIILDDNIWGRILDCFRNYKKRVTVIFNSNTIIRILSISACLRMLIIFNFLFYYAIWLAFVSVYLFPGKRWDATDPTSPVYFLLCQKKWIKIYSIWNVQIFNKYSNLWLYYLKAGKIKK